VAPIRMLVGSWDTSINDPLALLSRNHKSTPHKSWALLRGFFYFDFSQWLGLQSEQAIVGCHKLYYFTYSSFFNESLRRQHLIVYPVFKSSKVFANCNCLRMTIGIYEFSKRRH
jgi:hypothetical protein